MSATPRLRTVLLSAALAATLAAPLVQSAQAATPGGAAPAASAPVASTPSTFGETAPAPAHHPAGPAGEVAHGTASAGLPGPQGAPENANRQSTATAGQPVADPDGATTPTAPATLTAAAGCDLAAFSALSPTALADFLSDPAHGYDECLYPLLSSWRPELAKVLTQDHVRTVADRITSLAPDFDSANTHNPRGLWYFLHVAVYFDFSHKELDFGDDTTKAAIKSATAAYLANPHVFEPTEHAGNAMGEVFQANSGPGLRPGLLPLGERVMRQYATADSPYIGNRGWNWALQAALTINFQGINNVVEDKGRFQEAVADNPSYRQAIRAFAGYGHLKGTGTEWAARDAMLEFARLGSIPALLPEVKAEAGAVLTATRDNFGRLSPAWANAAIPVNDFGLCQAYDACRADLMRQFFPNTYSYDNGTLVVRTALDKATADQLYYATKQVKAQFFRTIGTDQPLADDTHPTLTVQLYDTKSNYQLLQNLLFGVGDVENGGMFIEEHSTFYTYQRLGTESYFSLEELFRHEYTHYLNARWAIPESGYTERWPADTTFAMNEGTAEYFAGATAKDGVKARKWMLTEIGWEKRDGKPRMTVDQILHATRDVGFRVYPYAAVFFNLLGEKHPEQLAEMYRLLRADDLDGYNAWRDRLGRDAGLQREYDDYLDTEVPRAGDLYVPATDFTPNGRLRFAYAYEVQDAFARATQNTPVCKDNADWNNTVRFTCTGRITTTLNNTVDAGRIRESMADTVDYYLLTRAGEAANNLADMNCWFGKVEVWPTGQAGSADYTCEGPLRR
ncbi:collagenase [Kitasatospora sp. NPDC057965]|uniref:collagenase n=1 Tax=Kitasatospora sp. NPDC057965 TaxID=3346291 RepID=UPI0036DACDD7